MIAFRRFGLVAAVSLAAAAAPALAQDVDTPPTAATPGQDLDTDRDTVTIGAAAGYLPDYEGSDNYEFTPIPGAVGSIKGYSFSVLGNRASVDVIRNQPGPSWDFQLGPVGVINFTRSDRQSIDDIRVRRLGDRDTAIELGGYVGIGKTGVITSPYDKLSVSLSYRYDVTGTHKSGIIQPTVNYLTPLSRRAAVGVFASAEHVERDYVATYYDVSPARSVASGLPVYSGGGGWKSYTLGGLATVAITGDLLHGFKLVAGGTYRRLLNDVAASPVVSVAGSRNQWLGAVGIAYTF